MDIGARIKYFRTRNGMSQEKLAWDAGINPAFLGELERGKKSPTVKTLEKIACALRINLYELFIGPDKISLEDNMLLQQITQQLRLQPTDTIQKISLIIQTILDIKK